MNQTPPNPPSGNGHRNRVDDLADEDSSPGESFSAAMSQFAELKEYAAQYIAARADSLKLSVRKVVLFAVLGVLGLLVGGAIMVTAASIFVIGISQLIAHWLGDRAWAGNLIVGILMIGLVAGGAWIMMRRMLGASRKATVERYERRLKQQRVLLAGHDARERSREYDRQS
jgi:hypothetical protein